jgi:protease-4
MSRLVLAALALWASACSVDLSAFTRIQPLEETVVFGESGPKIVLLEIDGVLTEERERASFGLELPSVVATVREALERAKDDDDVVALLLRVQSPGGTVSASETLYHELEVWKKETGLPVIAHFQGIAASGGYYLAMAADRIVAHPTTVTGSIGVVMLGINLTGLMEKVGVTDQTMKAGAFKDAGSPLRPMRPEERAQLQGVLDDLHKRFREVVAAGRPGIAPDAITRLSDGRVFTAPQALEAGLIDEIGYVETAVELAEKQAGIEESRVVVYHRPSEYRQNLYARGGLPPVQVVDVDVFSLGWPRLAPGFYYLWPAMLGPN